MRKRNNPIRLEHQRPRQIDFADEEQKALPLVTEWWNVNSESEAHTCDGETYENLDLRHIDFGGSSPIGYTSFITSLVGTSFINCDLRGCVLANCDLTNTNFYGSDLRGVTIIGRSIIHNTSFENVNLSSARFVTAQGDYLSCNWSNAFLEDTVFRNLEFLKFYLNNRNKGLFFGVPRFQEAILESANLKDANLQGIDLQDADLVSADLESANLKDANLQGAYLMGANLQKTNLERANLQDAYYNDETRGLSSEQKSVMVFFEG